MLKHSLPSLPPYHYLGAHRDVRGPLPKPVADAITACRAPWPYVTCVGTEFGNPHVRLISIDRPA